jgi:membrane protease YdiL (CAAX protease family)
MVGIVYYVFGWNLREDLGIKRPDLKIVSGIILIFLSFLSMTTAMLIQALIELAKMPESSEITSGIIDAVISQQDIFNGLPYALGFFAIVITAPIFEELFFRGVFDHAMSFLPAGIRIIIVASIFAIWHLLPALFPTLALLGILLGYVRYKTDNIWYSILIHFCKNLFGIILIPIFSLFGIDLLHFKVDSSSVNALSNVPTYLFFFGIAALIIGIFLLRISKKGGSSEQTMPYTGLEE